MTESERAQLVELLRRRFDTLRSTLREHLVASDDARDRLLADRVLDTEDESVTDLLIDTDLAGIDRELDELRDVEASLGRVRAGSYGTCVACEAPIPFARLSAYPTAKRCHRCQAQHEKTHAGSRTPRM